MFMMFTWPPVTVMFLRSCFSLARGASFIERDLLRRRTCRSVASFSATSFFFVYFSLSVDWVELSSPSMHPLAPCYTPSTTHDLTEVTIYTSSQRYQPRHDNFTFTSIANDARCLIFSFTSQRQLTKPRAAHGTDVIGLEVSFSIVLEIIHIFNRITFLNVSHTQCTEYTASEHTRKCR